VALRVKLRVRASRVIETTALVNTGFEVERPQLLIPLRLAKELGLWPPPPSAELIELGTAGGPVRNYMVPNALEVWVITEDREVGPVTCDALISNIETEVLINDKLAGELKIVILNPATGEWRFYDETITRHTESPTYWV